MPLQAREFKNIKNYCFSKFDGLINTESYNPCPMEVSTMKPPHNKPITSLARLSLFLSLTLTYSPCNCLVVYLHHTERIPQTRPRWSTQERDKSISSNWPVASIREINNSIISCSSALHRLPIDKFFLHADFFFTKYGDYTYYQLHQQLVTSKKMHVGQTTAQQLVYIYMPY